MTLSLAGPQSLGELNALAESFGNDLPAGDMAARQSPPSLMESSETSYQQVNDRCFDLLFAFEDLPSASPQALDFLCTWLNTGKPGGLLATLRQRGLADSLKATPLYEFAGQALLHIELKLDEPQRRNEIQPLLHDWLGFFTAQDDWASLRKELTAQLHCRQETGSALQLARSDSEGRDAPLSENDLLRLREILRQLQPAAHTTEAWQLPAPNPFLQTAAEPPRAGLIRGQTSAHRGLRTFAQDRSRGRRERSPMQFSQALADNPREGAVYLRWRLAAQAPHALQSRLERHLQALREEARHAGVDATVETSGNQILLKLVGLQAPMPLVLEHVLTKLGEPLPNAVDEAPLMPIRHLLRALTDQCRLSSRSETVPQPHSDQSLWATAEWDGLAIGLSETTQSAMGPALARVPGIAGQPVEPTPRLAQLLWRSLPTQGDEEAVLLFCPTPTQALSDEAAWRLLAQLCQTPFYQRLRVELQLGYAVFSGVRQIDGQTGLLFGVQSPSASAAELITHMEQFLEALPELIRQIDDSTLIDQQRILASQFHSDTLSCAQAAELLWQGKLAGRPSDYLQQLCDGIVGLNREQLLDAARRLNDVEGGRYCLSNGACPGEHWQVPE
jgi:coenzyme PQQ biosynthesis probable peptidase PqqF